ncbi:MAG: hypothetical protein WCP12_15130, partial [bacterium]
MIDPPHLLNKFIVYILSKSEIKRYAFSCISIAVLCNQRISASLSAFAEWLRIRNESLLPYC